MLRENGSIRILSNHLGLYALRIGAIGNTSTRMANPFPARNWRSNNRVSVGVARSDGAACGEACMDPRK